MSRSSSASVSFFSPASVAFWKEKKPRKCYIKGLTLEPRCYRQILLDSGGVGLTDTWCVSCLCGLHEVQIGEKEGDTFYFNCLITSSPQPKKVLLNLYLLGKLEKKTGFSPAFPQSQQTCSVKVPYTTQPMCKTLLPPMHHDNCELGTLCCAAPDLNKGIMSAYVKCI